MADADDRAIITHLDHSYSEADLDRICQALGLIPCDPSSTLIKEVFATLHAACARGWRGDPSVFPSWKDSVNG